MGQHLSGDRFVASKSSRKGGNMHYNRYSGVGGASRQRWRCQCEQFLFDKDVVAACPIRIDYVQLPDSYALRGKPH
jgi:hypothetical protein